MKSSYVCLSCCQPFTPSPIREILEGTPLLCDECLSKIVIKLEERNTFGFKTLFLSKLRWHLQDVADEFQGVRRCRSCPLFPGNVLTLDPASVSGPSLHSAALESGPGEEAGVCPSRPDAFMLPICPIRPASLKGNQEEQKWLSGSKRNAPKAISVAPGSLLWPGKESSCLTMSLPPEPR
jgi:DNA-directed RNA polymerase subunit RPC12/RpoP